MKKVVIVSAKRTAIGSFNGVLSSFSSGQLGSFAIKAVLEDSKIDLNLIDEVIMGNVLMGGQGQAPARQAAIFAGLPYKTECLTINKMCGSGLKSVISGYFESVPIAYTRMAELYEILKYRVSLSLRFGFKKKPISS